MLDVTLRPWQRPVSEFIAENLRCEVLAPMGSGKSLATLHGLADADDLVGDVFPMLIVAPKRVATVTWPEEVAKWTTLSCSVIAQDTPARRRKAALNIADVNTINYEMIPWLVEFFGDKWPYKTVVCDESSKLKGFRLRAGGKRAAALAKVAHKSVRYVGLTGTPTPQGVEDLWGQMWFVDGGDALGRTFGGFQSRWFAPIRLSKTNQHAMKWVPLPGAAKEITDRIKPKAITIDMSKYVKIDAPVLSIREFDLPPDARKIYDEFEHDMVADVRGKDISAVNGAIVSLKCLQVCNGAVYDDDKRWQAVHDEKLEILDEIIEEAAGMPVLVAYQFHPERDRILQRFPQARVLDAKPKTQLEWNEGKIPLMLAHPASCGHGLNLQWGGNILVYFSNWWNLEERMQILERIGPLRQMQAGLNRPVFVYVIAARNTIEQVVIARTDDKRSVQDAVLAYVADKR